MVAPLLNLSIFRPSLNSCSTGYVVHRYLFIWFILWVLLLPLWMVFTLLMLVFVGLGFMVVIVVHCKASRQAALGVFIFIFLPFMLILDMLSQACHWQCNCGPCSLPIRFEDV